MDSQDLDPRRNAFRADLADERLKEQVEAERFVAGERRQVRRASVASRRRPDPALGFDTELLFGETVLQFDVSDGWAWVQSERDGYVGYVPADALDEKGAPATHRVSAIGTFLYSSPDIKSPPLMHLSINTPLAVEEVADKFCRLATGGYVIARHVSAAGKVARDFVDVAERLIGVPYLWGGRTRIGVDCSGLVQIAMEAAGLACPRDSDMQAAEVGATLLVPDSLDGLRRGDLMFWQGHVGIMVDGVMLLHANAHHMAVVVEPVAVAVARNQKAGLDIRTVKRPPALSADPIILTTA
jgi:cell wall-associated NlpC family hydrolase